MGVPDTNVVVFCSLVEEFLEAIEGEWVVVEVRK